MLHKGGFISYTVCRYELCALQSVIGNTHVTRVERAASSFHKILRGYSSYAVSSTAYMLNDLNFECMLLTMTARILIAFSLCDVGTA